MPKTVALAACGLGTLMIIAGLRLSRLGRETSSFTRTPGRVLVAHVDEIPGSAEQGGAQFKPVIRYGFEARGRTYESEQISADAPSGAAASSDAQDARRWVARYPPGSVVDVWLDPADPRRSVLVRGVASAQVYAAVVIGIALVAFGMFGLAR